VSQSLQLMREGWVASTKDFKELLTLCPWFYWKFNYFFNLIVKLLLLIILLFLLQDFMIRGVPVSRWKSDVKINEKQKDPSAYQALGKPKNKQLHR
jgi:hypothetical protein